MSIHTDEAAQQKKDNREAKREAELDRAIRQKVVNGLFSNPEGRRFLWWVLKIGHAIGENPYRGTDRDTAFTCGEQNVGQQFLRFIIETDPIAFTNLMKEQELNARSRRANHAKSVADAESARDNALDPEFGPEPEPAAYS